MNQERCEELLNNLINHLSVAENTNTVIKELFRIGFTEDELITEFAFAENDVKEAAKEISQES